MTEIFITPFRALNGTNRHHNKQNSNRLTSSVRGLMEKQFLLRKEEIDEEDSLKQLKASESDKPHYDVFVRINMFQISDVDTVACTFAANFFLTATWRDHELDYETLKNIKDPKDPKAQSKKIQESFDPKLMFMNAVGSPKYEDNFELDWMRGRDGSPAVCVRMEVTGTFREQFELRSFPMDAQPLNILITSHNRKDILTLHGDDDKESSRTRTEFMILNEFELSPVRFCSAKTVHKHHAGYPLLYAGVIVSRNYGYHLWNVFLPTFLITLMSVTTFSVPLEEVSDRCGVILTLVLTSVAYKFIVSQGLPKISYCTFLDTYVMISFLFLTVIALGVSLVGYVSKHISEEGASTMDKVFFRTSVSFFFIWHFATALVAMMYINSRKKRSIGPSPELLSTKKIVKLD